MTWSRRSSMAGALSFVIAGAVAVLAGLGVSPFTARAVSAADRDLLVRVRLAGLWEQPASLAALARARSPAVREIAERIAGEHHDLDQIVLDTAAHLGVEVPDEPNAAQQQWLDELNSTRGAEFDRVYVERLRAAHGVVLPIIAAVRGGTRNDTIRQFATVAAEYVSRHLGYLDDTGLVNFVTLPSPSATGGQDYGNTITDDGAQLPADRELLLNVHAAGLWQSEAAQNAHTRSGSEAVRAIATAIDADQSETLLATASIAARLGTPLPDHPSADERDLLSALRDSRDDQHDQKFLETLRRTDSELLLEATHVRAGTRHTVIRAFAALIIATLLDEMTLIEASGLIDYNQLPHQAPPELRTSTFERDGGLPTILVWIILGAAALTAAISVALKAPTP